MKNKTILILVMLAVVLLLVSCSKKEVDDTKITRANAVQKTDEIVGDVNERNLGYMTETGGIKIGKDGAIRRGEKIDAPVVIDFFFDPVCLSCSQYNDIVGEEMKDKILKKEIGVIFHPAPYLNDKSPDDYSNRASAYMLAVAEYAPDKILPFIQILLSEKFRPENPADDITSDNKFIEAMQDSSLTDDEIEKVEFNKDSFVSIAIAAGKEFSSDNSQWTKFSKVTDANGNKIIFTPFILVNKNGSSNSDSLNLEGDLIKELNEAISESLK